MPYSIHSFMLPLRWDYLPEKYDSTEGKESVSFEERTCLKKFAALLTADNSGWKRKFFRINGKSDNYNEYHYFHAYCSNTLFDLQQRKEDSESIIGDGKVMLYFELVDNKDRDKSFYYEINTAIDGNYKLLLTGISLHVYNTGVAVLTFNLENEEYKSKEAVLKINEFGRHIYPQFLNDRYAEEKPPDGVVVKSDHTTNVKNAFLADKITVCLGGGKLVTDDFSEYADVQNREVHHCDENSVYGNDWVVRMPVFVRGLFNNKFRYTLGEEGPEGTERIRFNVLGDDRMFFQSWCGDNVVATELSKMEKVSEQDEFIFTKNPFWYAYIFGDKKNPSIANAKLQAKQCSIHTYDRWAGYGTLIGFSRDSFVAVSSDVATLLENNAPDLSVHMKTIYYQMAVLCIAQRASLLRFSAETTSLADPSRTADDETLVNNTKILYRNYIEYINKINFREITPYIQGNEMYAQFREIMQTQKDVEALDKELNELFTYIKLYEDEKQTAYSERLNKIATWFLPAGFLASLFGIGLITENTKFIGKPIPNIWIAWIIIISIGGISSLLLLYFNKLLLYFSNKKKKNHV